MSFNSLLTHRVTTYRNLPNGTGIQKSYQQNLINQPCMIQPLSAAYAAQANMVFGRAYNLFVPLGTDLQLSDKLVDQDGKSYEISGSLKRNYGANAHLTFLINETLTAGIPDQ